MPSTHAPRSGTMQVWPRKRAKKTKVRSWTKLQKDVKPLGFAGFKAGMTHVLYTDNKKSTLTKGMDVSSPVTIIECPPLKVFSIRFYKETENGLQASAQILAQNFDKQLKRKISIPKKNDKKIDDIKEFDDVVLVVHTQPSLTGIGSKKPQIFEIALSGKKEDKLDYAKEKLGKDLTVNDMFKEGELIDIHAITTGKGYQGPVKRFGIAIRESKSEKTIRGPGTLGGWKGHGHFMYRVAHAGQMGYHLRTQYNKWLLKIGTKPEEINPKGGFIRYGVVKNNYVLFKGSINGPKKRLIRFNHAMRPNNKTPKQAPSITYTSLESKQGN